MRLHAKSVQAREKQKLYATHIILIERSTNKHWLRLIAYMFAHEE